MKNFKYTNFFALSLLLIPTAFATSPQKLPLILGYQSYAYTCPNKEQIKVAYVTTGQEKSAMPIFLVLNYKNMNYGLSSAVSASGSRYLGQFNDKQVLEWWEHGGEAKLSIFKDDASKKEVSNLTCKIKSN